MVDSNHDDEETSYTTKLEHFFLMALLNVGKVAELILRYIRETTVPLVKAEIARLEEPKLRAARRNNRAKHEAKRAVREGQEALQDTQRAKRLQRDHAQDAAR